MSEHQVALALALIFGCAFLLTGFYQLLVGLRSGIVQFADLGKVKKSDEPIMFWIGAAIWIFITAMGVFVLWGVFHWRLAVI